MKHSAFLKSLLAMILAICMTLSLLPAGTLAEDGETTGEETQQNSATGAEEQPAASTGGTEQPAASTGETEQPQTESPTSSGEQGSGGESSGSTQETEQSQQNPEQTQQSGEASGQSTEPKTGETVEQEDTALPVTQDETGSEDDEQVEATSVQAEDETISIGGTITWRNETEGASRPTLTIRLLQNGTAIEKILTKGTSYSFAGLAKLDGQGQAYSYKISVPRSVSDYAVSCSGNNITATYSPSEKAQTLAPAVMAAAPSQAQSVQPIQLTVQFVWAGVPEGASPTARATVASTNTAANGLTAGPVAAGTAASSLGEFDAADGEGNAYTYALASASADEIENYYKDVSIDGLTVTISYTEKSAVDALVLQITADIDALPTVEQMGNLTLKSQEHMSAALAVLAVGRKLAGLTDSQRAMVTNLDHYAALQSSGYIMSALSRSMVESVNVTFTVSWDVADESAIPSGDLSFGLMRDGTLVSGTTVTLNKSSISGKTWTGTFSSLDKSRVNGTQYVYSVSWPGVTGFTITSGATTATYRQSSGSASYTVQIIWAGEPVVNCPPRPASLTVGLTNATGSSITGAMTAAEGWAKTFTDISPTSATAPVGVILSSGAPSGYTASYSSGGAGKLTITLTYTAQMINISGTISWPLLPAGVTKPATVCINLVQSTPSGSHFVVSGIDVNTTTENQFTFSGYPRYDAYGNEIYYGIVESGAAGFTPEYSGYNVINHLNTANEVNLRVTVRWNDQGNKRCRRPIETTVYLYRDGVATGDSIQLRYADQWTAIFPDQPRTDGYGHYYNYSVRGAKVPYYYSRTVYANRGAAVTLTYVYGSGSSDTATTTTDTATKAPAVSDVLALYGTRLGLADRLALYQEDLRADSVNRQISLVAGASQTTGSEIDFTSLKKTNSDVAAWIRLEGTQIDYPVVRGTNNSYYLTHLFNKEANRSGALFMDTGCNKDSMKNRNTVIYGHHMAAGSMFANLLEYKQQSYYDAHPTMMLYTPDGNYQIQLFAAFTTGDEYSAVSRLSFSGDSDFMAYVNTCIKKSDFNTGVDVKADDHLITLVTCSYDYDNTRYLVMGRLTPAS